MSITRLDWTAASSINTASFTLTGTATVVAVNDPPTLSATAINPNYNELAPAVAVFSGT